MSSTAATVTHSTYEAPSPLSLPESLNLDNVEGLPSLSPPKICSPFSRINTRPSFVTNKMSPYNSIKRSQSKDSGRLLTRLPSVKNERKHRTSSGSSTPELSRSNSTTSSNTPVLSPESISDSLSHITEISSFKLGRKRSMESLSSSDNSSQYPGLAKDDQYLLQLKDVEGLSCWSEIAERMCQKGYQVQQRGLRTRYCILKRDLDVSLQKNMENLNNMQSEVNEILGSSSCPVRRLASFKNKKMASNLRVYDEEEEVVDPRVWEELAASFRASGLR